MTRWEYAILSVELTDLVSDYQESPCVTEFDGLANVPSQPNHARRVAMYVHERAERKSKSLIAQLTDPEAVTELANMICFRSYGPYFAVAHTADKKPPSPSSTDWTPATLGRKRYPDLNINPDVVIVQTLSKLGKEGWEVCNVETTNVLTGSSGARTTKWVSRSYTLKRRIEE